METSMKTWNGNLVNFVSDAEIYLGVLAPPKEPSAESALEVFGVHSYNLIELDAMDALYKLGVADSYNQACSLIRECSLVSDNGILKVLLLTNEANFKLTIWLAPISRTSNDWRVTQNQRIWRGM